MSIPISGMVDREKDVFINELELITIIIVLKVWTDRVKNRNVLAY